MVKRRDNTAKGRIPERDSMRFDLPSYWGRGRPKGVEPEYTEPLTTEQAAIIQKHATALHEVRGWVWSRLRREFGGIVAERYNEAVDDQVHKFAVNAARAWDPAKGAKFSTFLTNMRLALLCRVKRFVDRAIQRREVSILMTARTRGTKHRHREEIVTNGRMRERPTLESVLSGESAKVAEALLDQLFEPEAQVLRMRYGIGQERLTLAETAAALGTTRTAVRVLETRALMDLGALEGMGHPCVTDPSLAKRADMPGSDI